MKTHMICLLGCLAGMTATGLRGQSPAPAAPADNLENIAPPITPADAPPSVAEEASKPKRQRAVSSEISQSISAGMPKFNPPSPTPVVQEEDKPDLREIDKPKNGIIRLPSYVLRADRSPILRERDVYTQSGLAALAMKRYFSDLDRGLNTFYLPVFGYSPEKRAMAAYAEGERLNNMVELRDDAATAGLSDSKESAYIKRESQDTYMRRGDFGYQGNSPARDSFGYEGNTPGH